MENGTRQTCYDNDNSIYGWCGVCDPTASEGQEGFCPEDTHRTWGMYLSEEATKEAVRVKPDDKWGWCDKQCWAKHFAQSAISSNLQVAHVNILGKESCVRHRSILQFET